MKNPFKRLIVPGLLLLIIVVTGLLVYTQIEGWSLLDACYMLVITLFTVGFEEVHALSLPGRIFTMLLIISGVGTALYAVGQFGEIIIEGQLFGYRRRKRMEQQLKNLQGHYIICGFGRVGHRVMEEFISEKVPFVVVDNKETTAEELESKGVPYVIGSSSSTNGELEKAGVKKAKGLISCADSDMENVFITLSARAANPDLYIVARASSKDAEEKLKMAGANRVLAPYFISGRRMAALALRPVTSDFLDMVMHGDKIEFTLREIIVQPQSQLLNKSLGETQVHQKSGATIMAIRKADGSFDLQPAVTSKIELGDILIAIGTQEQLDNLERMGK